MEPETRKVTETFNESLFDAAAALKLKTEAMNEQLAYVTGQRDGFHSAIVTFVSCVLAFVIAVAIIKGRIYGSETR